MFKFDLHPQEKLVKMIRQSESVLFKPVLIILLAVYVPWFLILKYEMFGRFYRLLFFWTILLFFYGIYKYLIWLLNVNLITNQRVIKISYQNLFDKHVGETLLSRIVNISFSTHGLLASLMDYGTVELQLANVPQPLLLTKIRQPQKIKDLLWQIRASQSHKMSIHPNLQKSGRL